jgi:hypothetical protein
MPQHRDAAAPQISEGDKQAKLKEQFIAEVDDVRTELVAELDRERGEREFMNVELRRLVEESQQTVVRFVANLELETTALRTSVDSKIEGQQSAITELALKVDTSEQELRTELARFVADFSRRLEVFEQKFLASTQQGSNISSATDGAAKIQRSIKVQSSRAEQGDITKPSAKADICEGRRHPQETFIVSERALAEVVPEAKKDQAERRMDPLLGRAVTYAELMATHLASNVPVAPAYWNTLAVETQGSKCAEFADVEISETAADKLLEFDQELARAAILSSNTASPMKSAVEWSPVKYAAVGTPSPMSLSLPSETQSVTESSAAPIGSSSRRSPRFSFNAVPRSAPAIPTTPNATTPSTPLQAAAKTQSQPAPRILQAATFPLGVVAVSGGGQSGGFPLGGPAVSGGNQPVAFPVRAAAISGSGSASTASVGSGGRNVEQTLASLSAAHNQDFLSSSIGVANPLVRRSSSTPSLNSRGRAILQQPVAPALTPTMVATTSLQFSARGVQTSANGLSAPSSLRFPNDEPSRPTFGLSAPSSLRFAKDGSSSTRSVDLFANLPQISGLMPKGTTPASS